MELKPGEVVVIDGQRLRYLGEGRFEPADEVLAKRFDMDDARPLGGPACD
jgi:hypothetical protein